MVLNIKGGKTTSLKDKKPKKEKSELGEEDIALKAKQKADAEAAAAYIKAKGLKKK